MKLLAEIKGYPSDRRSVRRLGIQGYRDCQAKLGLNEFGVSYSRKRVSVPCDRFDRRRPRNAPQR
jgi:hypothetical protein